MNQYKEILNELYNTIDKINEYQSKANDLQRIIGDESSKNKKIIEEQNESLEQLKTKVTYYIEEYNNSFDHIMEKVSIEFETSTNKSLEVIKNELSSETNILMETIMKSLNEVYGNLNKERKELIDNLELTLNHNKNETSIVKDIEKEIKEQNKYLKTINDESKNYIDTYIKEIKTLKEELDLLKENFELKYVYNKKRVIITSIYSFIMIMMITIVGLTTFYMFAYYFKLIYFPQIIHPLIIGILLIILGLGLVFQLIFTIFRPPTFLKVGKGKKRNRNKKN